MTCSICESEARQGIEEALAAGEALRDIASRFGTSKSALGRHRDHIEFSGAVMVEELAPGDPGVEDMEENDQAGQAAIMEAAPVKEPPKPLSPAEQEWNKFCDELERLEAKARQQSPGLEEAIGRLYDEERPARQKLAILAEREAKLVQELTNLQAEQLEMVERGETGNPSDDLARVAEELTSIRQAVQAEQVRFEELAHQVKDRVHGLRAQIRGLEQAPADFMGKIWKAWWFQLDKAEEEVEGGKTNLREQTRDSAGRSSKAIRGFADLVEEWEIELARTTAERDLLRYLVGRLADLLKKEPIYQEALIHARVLPPGWEWPPRIKQIERYGLDGAQVRERFIPDPRWA